MTTRDIQEIVKLLYGVDVSPTLISEITADLDAEVTGRRKRLLDPVWPIVYLDGIVADAPGRGQPPAVAQDDVRGFRREYAGPQGAFGDFWLGEAEGAKFWLSCLTDLKNRGLKDIFIACIDGLWGFAEALRPHTPTRKRDDYCAPGGRRAVLSTSRTRTVIR